MPSRPLITPSSEKVASSGREPNSIVVVGRTIGQSSTIREKAFRSFPPVTTA